MSQLFSQLLTAGERIDMIDIDEISVLQLIVLPVEEQDAGFLFQGGINFLPAIAKVLAADGLHTVLADGVDETDDAI